MKNGSLVKQKKKSIYLFTPSLVLLYLQIQDNDGLSNTEHPPVSSKPKDACDDAGSAPEKPSPERFYYATAAPNQEVSLLQ